MVLRRLRHDQGATAARTRLPPPARATPRSTRSNQFQYHHQPFVYFDNYAPFDTTNTVPTAYVGGFAGYGTTGLTAGQSGVTRAQNSAAHVQDEQHFFDDVANNTLPSVCFIKPVGVNNEHPGYSALQIGQQHVASIVQAVQNNPALWAHTAIVITYDEHGGRWDHVTPPARDIWGPGERVPCIVISPFARKGFVNSTQFDTSSILATIEARFVPGPEHQRGHGGGPDARERVHLAGHRAQRLHGQSPREHGDADRHGDEPRQHEHG